MNSGIKWEFISRDFARLIIGNSILIVDDTHCRAEAVAIVDGEEVEREYFYMSYPALSSMDNAMQYLEQKYT